MLAPDTSADRVAAVAKLTPAGLARTLALQPHIAAWSVGCGPLTNLLMRHVTGAPNRRRLATALASSEAIRLTLLMLEPAALQLISVAAARGGTLTCDDVDRELAPLPPDERSRLIEHLADRMLIDPTKGHVVLRPGVAGLIGLPGRPLDRLLLDQSITTDHVAGWLRRLGVHPVPSKKSERITALHTVFANPSAVHKLVDSFDPDQSAMLRSLLTAGGHGIHVGRLGVDWWRLRLRADILPRSQQPGQAHGSTVALRALIDLGLVWVDDVVQYVGLWLEVLTAINGRTYAAWPTAPPAPPLALDPTASLLPSSLGVFQNLLRHVADEPMIGLKTGGIGVKSIRDLAKRLGQPEPQISLLVRLAIGTGLVPMTSELVGKGRQQSWINHFELDRVAFDQWTATDAGGQWRTLVAGWLDGVDVAADDHTMVSVLRRQLVADLQALPEDHGVARSDAVQWFVQSHFAADRVDADSLITELVSLGLAPAAGPVGLTSLARVLLADPHALADLLPAHDITFVVQADLTVVAPPSLDPDIRSRLDQLCTVESSGSVTVLRLDRSRVAAALASGETSAALAHFLHTHSSVPVAPVVAQMLADVERQRSGLAAVSATTVVTADDVLGLAAAVKVKAARLTLIAPTVAISDLPLAKVLGALRAKGLAPSNANRSVGNTDRRSDRIVHRVPVRAQGQRPTGAIHPHTAQLERLVESW